MHKIYLRQVLMHVWVQQSAEAFICENVGYVAWLEIQYSMRFDLQAQIYINCGFA
jgi:hypothetical protein